MQNLGGFFGIYAFTHMTAANRPQEGVRDVVRCGDVGYGVHVLEPARVLSDIFWMIPLMGFCQLALFGGYAIYFPELFPTRLRSTGTSFLLQRRTLRGGRRTARAGAADAGVLCRYAEPMRYAGVTMCLVFLVGMATIP